MPEKKGFFEKRKEEKLAALEAERSEAAKTYGLHRKLLADFYLEAVAKVLASKDTSMPSVIEHAADRHLKAAGELVKRVLAGDAKAEKEIGSHVESYFARRRMRAIKGEETPDEEEEKHKRLLSNVQNARLALDQALDRLEKARQG
jgi:hypothetical protein